MTDRSYQSPVISQEIGLAVIPEEVQLPSPNTSEDEIVRIPAPRVEEVPEVSGQRCWTARKAQRLEGPGSTGGAGRLFVRSTGLRGKNRA